MKQLLILSLLTFILFNNCDNNLPIIGKKEKTNAEKLKERLPLNCYFARFAGTGLGTRIVDNGDGKLSIISFRTIGSEFCPPPFNRTETIEKSESRTVNKCLNGQVYRKSQNDCKGIGALANYWGAEKFQFCTTNVKTCANASPAKKACSFISMTGETIFFSNGNLYSRFPEFREYFQNRPDEIPSAPTDYYWDISSAVIFNFRGQVMDTNFDNFYYIIC